MILSTAPALLPSREATRLLSLQHYDVMHLLRETVFKEFVCLATSMFQASSSHLSVVMARQVRYLASAGRLAPAPQPSQQAMCAQVVASNRAIICQDLQLSPAQRVPRQVSAAALALGLRFYAGVPLRLPNQAVIGALCVLDQQPRSCLGQEQHLLELLASLIERTLVVCHGCLTSPWLGAEYWQLTQDYIVDTLRRAKQQLRPARKRRPNLIAWPASRLLPVIQRLHQLNQVLAEPLPGFA